ncbi:hypothetical protein GCM10010206_17200 [Streptomyces cinerochromogenes]|nr:hypothetical protein GCM10010206_17200 [Streptomyces cinerochromogenes]
MGTGIGTGIRNAIGTAIGAGIRNAIGIRTGGSAWRIRHGDHPFLAQSHIDPALWSQEAVDVVR